MNSKSSNSRFEQEFLSNVVHGLGQLEKQLPCKYFYDERGSELFDRICELDEYYLSRTEQAIMDIHAKDMSLQLGERIMLVEFGSGSSTKTHALLENLTHPSAYVPVDISEDHLMKTVIGLQEKFPRIEIFPIVADFTQPFELPQPASPPSHTAVYFPGSTIGNFEPLGVKQLLSGIAARVGHDGGLLIGIDLQKESSIIHAAYNDSKGVTDQFNLNILNRINVELGANFDIHQFEHLAFYNQVMERIELYIVSRCDQSVKIGSQTFVFTEGERIFTEYSHKYSIEGFAELAGGAGFTLKQFWTDKQALFAVLYLVHKKTRGHFKT